MDRDNAIRSNFHAAVLAGINLFSILLGFALFQLLPGSNQIAVQVPIAIAASAGFFVLWNLLLRLRCPERLQMHGWSDGRRILAFSLIWAALLFVPLHHLTRGYLTSSGNLIALWGFQLVANPAAIGVSLVVRGRSLAHRADSRSGGSSGP